MIFLHGRFFSFHGRFFSFHGRFFSFHGRSFSYHGGYSEPEAVPVIERMAREASQSDMRDGISGANSPSSLGYFLRGGHELIKPFC